MGRGEARPGQKGERASRRGDKEKTHVLSGWGLARPLPSPSPSPHPPARRPPTCPTPTPLGCGGTDDEWPIQRRSACPGRSSGTAAASRRRPALIGRDCILSA
ncbi:unnamed protein product [Protopolystoma xenopodis]|uniref:Uncharacterized protein n=1 Tax=Protopolystoma xenopodis TaxID=117903 RepID=A0A3S5AIB3_9PLAT|nr:unnamed protein product [Protopolystoma xenopodis]